MMACRYAARKALGGLEGERHQKLDNEDSFMECSWAVYECKGLYSKV